MELTNEWTLKGTIGAKGYTFDYAPLPSSHDQYPLACRFFKMLYILSTFTDIILPFMKSVF